MGKNDTLLSDGFYERANQVQKLLDSQNPETNQNEKILELLLDLNKKVDQVLNEIDFIFNDHFLSTGRWSRFITDSDKIQTIPSRLAKRIRMP